MGILQKRDGLWFCFVSAPAYAILLLVVCVCNDEYLLNPIPKGYIIMFFFCCFFCLSYELFLCFSFFRLLYWWNERYRVCMIGITTAGLDKHSVIKAINVLVNLGYFGGRVDPFCSINQ